MDMGTNAADALGEDKTFLYGHALHDTLDAPVCRVVRYLCVDDHFIIDKEPRPERFQEGRMDDAERHLDLGAFFSVSVCH
jgi:hypothetical protein